MAVITKQQLEDAGIDAEVLAALLNNLGTVQTRLGVTVKTFRQVLNEMASDIPAKSYTTESALLADLTIDDGLVAFAIDTQRFYLKVGASGSGSWDGPIGLDDNNIISATIRNENYLNGSNKITNSKFEKDALASTDTPLGFTSTNAGTAGITKAPSEIAELANPAIQTMRVLKLAHTRVNSGANNTDYQLYQTVDIPEALWGDTSLVARFLYFVNRENAGIRTVGYAYQVDGGGADLSGAEMTKVSTDGGVDEWYPVICEIPVTNALARKLRVGARTATSSAASDFSANCYIVGIFCGFGRQGFAAYDNNLDEMLEDKVSANIAADYIISRLKNEPWKFSTNAVKNALFSADALSLNTVPTGYEVLTGGATGEKPPYEIAQQATPFNSNKALKATHYWNGTKNSDIQLAQTIDVPEEEQGNTSLIARFIYYVKADATAKANVSFWSYAEMYDENDALLSGFYPTKVSTDGNADEWFSVIFDVPVTNALARKVRFRCRQQASTASIFSGGVTYQSAMFVGWGLVSQETYDRNLDYEIEQKATEVANQIATGFVTNQTGVSTNDVYSDERGNVFKAVPSVEINCFGDSLTAANWAATLSGLFTPARECNNRGIGGETADQILARIKGFEFDGTGITWTPGTIRLRAKRALPPRLVNETYRSSWESYGFTISEPSSVEFFNADGFIAKTFDQFTANCTSNGTVTISSTGHPFSDGDIVYCNDATNPAEMYRYKPYFVKNSTANTFELSEFNGDVSISFSAETFTLKGDFYYDWVYSSQDNNVYSLTKTNTDSACFTFWMGTNNVNDPSQTKADLIEAVKHIKTFAKRFCIIGMINAETWITGTTESDNLTEVNTFIANQYPDNFIDIRTVLRANGDGSPEDNADIANGIIPRSLRVDSVHLTTAGYNLVANEVYTFYNSKGW